MARNDRQRIDWILSRLRWSPIERTWLSTLAAAVRAEPEPSSAAAQAEQLTLIERNPLEGVAPRRPGRVPFRRRAKSTGPRS